MAAEKKLAGYICTGCGIGERLDANRLQAVATREGKVANVKQHPMLCGAEGVALIQTDIDAGEATHVMIAACSRRSKVEAFSFPTVALSRANLREGVIWARPEGAEHQETTQEMADDYVRMACAEIKFMTVPESSGEQELNKTLLVVGGGVTGMTAAVEAAKAGYPVHLVCDEPVLGGVWKDLYKRVPFRAAAADVPNGNDVDLPMPEDPGLDDLIEQVMAQGRITVHLNARITKTSGAPGRFSADISTESGSTLTENFGAIVQASDFKPYDANQLPEFAYGQTPDVLTNFEFERLAKAANGGRHQAAVGWPGSQGRRLPPVRRSALRARTATCLIVPASAAPNRSSRRCTSRPRTRAATPPSCSMTCGPPAPPVRTSTAPVSRPWSPSPRARRPPWSRTAAPCGSSSRT